MAKTTKKQAAQPIRVVRRKDAVELFGDAGSLKRHEDLLVQPGKLTAAQLGALRLTKTTEAAVRGMARRALGVEVAIDARLMLSLRTRGVVGVACEGDGTSWTIWVSPRGEEALAKAGPPAGTPPATNEEGRQ